MSRTPDSVARCPKHDDQLTQEQFDNELEKDLEVMLTQEQCDEEEGGAEGRAGEAAKGEEEEEGGQGSTAATTPVDRIREPTS